MFRNQRNRIRDRVLLCLLLLVVALCPQGSASAAAGDLLWEDSIYGYVSVYGGLIGAENGKVFAHVSGPFRHSPGSNSAVTIRAYEPRTGALLWSDRWDVSDKDDQGYGITGNGNLIFVMASTYLNSLDSRASVQVRAYDGDTGDVVWSDSCGQGNHYNTRGWQIATSGELLFMSGACRGRHFLKTYEASTGQPVWDLDAPPNATLAAFGGQVFVAGQDGPGPLVLRSHDAGTGALSWESPPIDEDPSTRISGIKPGGDVVILVGDWYGHDHRIQALDSHDGALLWSVDLESERGIKFDRQGNQILVTGSFGLRVYEARTGDVLSEDPEGGDYFRGGAVLGSRWFIAGTRYRTSLPLPGFQEFFIQAYDLK